MSPTASGRARMCLWATLVFLGATVLMAGVAQVQARGMDSPTAGDSGRARRPSSALALVSIPASKDNTLYESSNGSLSSGAGEYMFAGTTNTDRLRRGVVAFDVAFSIPSGATIVSTTLILHMSRTSSGANPVALHRLLEEWGEGASVAPSNGGAGTSAEIGDATWVHRSYDNLFWFTEGGEFAPTASAAIDVSGEGYYRWSSTPQMVADVQLWLESPLQSQGWLLLGREDINQTSKRFDTKENSAPSRRPELLIEYTLDTPTPSPTASTTPTAGPSSTPTDTGTPTDTATASPSPTRTATRTRTATYTPSLTPSTTPTPQDTSTPQDTATVTATAMATAVATSTDTSVPADTLTPTSTATPIPTNIPTSSPTPTAAGTAADTATSTPTSQVATLTPTATGTPVASSTSTSIPTSTRTATPTFTPSPTLTSTPTFTPSPTLTATPYPTLGLQPYVCAYIVNRVPPVAIVAALANPQLVNGFGDRAVPGLPPSPFNPPRRWLSIQTVSLPYHQLYNSLVYKAGCP